MDLNEMINWRFLAAVAVVVIGISMLLAVIGLGVKKNATYSEFGDKIGLKFVCLVSALVLCTGVVAGVAILISESAPDVIPGVPTNVPDQPGSEATDEPAPRGR